MPLPMRSYRPLRRKPSRRFAAIVRRFAFSLSDMCCNRLCAMMAASLAFCSSRRACSSFSRRSSTRVADPARDGRARERDARGEGERSHRGVAAAPPPRTRNRRGPTRLDRPVIEERFEVFREPLSGRVASAGGITCPSLSAQSFQVAWNVGVELARAGAGLRRRLA